MIGNVSTKVTALSEEEETSKVHYTSTSSRRILFFKTSFAGVNAAPGRAPDGARRHPSTRGHDVEGCVLLQVADHETNDGMRWTEWNRKKKKMYAPRLQLWATAKGVDMEQDVWNATRRDVASAHARTTPYGRWAQYTKVGRYSFLFFIRRANIRMELTSEEVREHLVSE